MGQQTPRTSTTQDIQDAIQDFAFGMFLPSPAGLGLGHIGSDQLPLLVASVGRVRFSGFHVPKLPHMTPSMQNFLNTFLDAKSKSNHKTLAHAIFRNPYPAEFCGYPTVPILCGLI
jgi:hypothetical protein